MKNSLQDVRDEATICSFDLSLGAFCSCRASQHGRTDEDEPPSRNGHGPTGTATLETTGAVGLLCFSQSAIKTMRDISPHPSIYILSL